MQGEYFATCELPPLCYIDCSSQQKFVETKPENNASSISTKEEALVSLSTSTPIKNNNKEVEERIQNFKCARSTCVKGPLCNNLVFQKYLTYNLRINDKNVIKDYVTSMAARLKCNICFLLLHCLSSIISVKIFNPTFIFQIFKNPSRSGLKEIAITSSEIIIP
jgi:hypothetical protein